MAAWLPGTEGEGIADVLFGDFKPTGKLPRPWPRNNSELNSAAFVAAGAQPLFSSGFGLTCDATVKSDKTKSPPRVNKNHLAATGIYFWFFVLATPVLAGNVLTNLNSTAAVPNGGWNLVWNDEFTQADGSAPDLASGVTMLVETDGATANWNTTHPGQTTFASKTVNW